MIKEYFGHTIDIKEIAAISKKRIVMGLHRIEFCIYLKGSAKLECMIPFLETEKHPSCPGLIKSDGTIRAMYGPDCIAYSRIQPMIDELINDWKEAPQ